MYETCHVISVAALRQSWWNEPENLMNYELKFARFCSASAAEVYYHIHCIRNYDKINYHLIHDDVSSFLNCG